jgi:cytochrome c oxidase cbb3-type subunit 2
MAKKEGLQAKLEKNSFYLTIMTVFVISIGGIVEIAPLFYLDSTIEKVEGMRPYSPLELMGREVYLREGCYVCHSQQIRSLRDEVERYGHYSLAAESMYDHPFQWGSKRTGPDLARVGGRYSDEWHVLHMNDPRSMVPESVMPSYPWLARTPVEDVKISKYLDTLRIVGVPYSDQDILMAGTDLKTQVDMDSDNFDAFMERYPKAVVRDFDGNPAIISELDALIAYLQMLGTLVDFTGRDHTQDFR